MKFSFLPMVILLFMTGCQSDPGKTVDNKTDTLTANNTGPITVSQNEEDTSITGKSTENKPVAKPDSALSCEELIDRLIRSSNLDLEIKKMSKAVDKIDNKVITVKVYNRNDVENGNMMDVAIAWLEIDLNKKQLSDITLDLDHPKKLTFDRKWMDLMRSECLIKTEAENGSPELAGFKQFANAYFEAVKKNDTSYLRLHTIFPIKNSTFDVFDRSLEGRPITSKLFLNNIPKLFPGDLLQKIGSAEYGISDHPGAKKLYVVTVYSEEGGVESNSSWIFEKKQNEYYFTNFRSEAG